MRAQSTLATALLVPALALTLTCGVGCGASNATSGDPAAQTARDIATVQQRLAGQWRLAEYRPEVPLEMMFQALLASQIQTMVVRFENGRLLADSPTIHLSRAYTINNVAGNLFRLVATDDAGVALQSSCQISEDGGTILFRGDTAPWRGEGVLRRDR
jgi:hypothetical protein